MLINGLPQIKLWCIEDNHFPEDEDYEGWGVPVLADANEDEISLEELVDQEDEDWSEEDDLEEV